VGDNLFEETRFGNWWGKGNRRITGTANEGSKKEKHDKES
jgi:hypothetical protein